MRIVGRGMVVTALLAVMAAVGVARADNNPGGLAFRAVGFFRGAGDVKDGQITCEIPTVKSAIPDTSFDIGLWNTFGRANIYFPDVNGIFTDPCGGYLQVQNNMIEQSIALDHVVLNYKIPGARRFRQFVPTRNGFPIACRQLRRETIFAGMVLDPIGSDRETQSGEANVGLVRILPLVSTQMFNCLRGQYGALSTDLYSSLPLVIRATAFGVADSGETFKSNTINYTLNLRHTCGNGRVDDGELCDPGEPNPCAHGTCVGGLCSLDITKTCADDSECNGTCTSSNVPEECICIF